MSRIAAIVHFYSNWRSAGSETVLHECLKRMRLEGHEVRAYVTVAPRGAAEVEFEGIRVIPVRSAMHAISLMTSENWYPHVTFTHHDNAVATLQMRRRLRSRIVFLTHNDMRPTEVPLRLKPDLVVWNSEWVKESLEKRVVEARSLLNLVMHPPLDFAKHRVDVVRGSAVTLVNHNAHKGAHVLFGLAEQMPERRFIAVQGGHGDQVPIPKHLTNIEQWKQNPDMRPVWAESRIVLMPSVYESYGLVSVEAGCSGIPVIAHPTPGLREALGEGGLFVDRNDIDGYADVIEMLDDEALYETFSLRARLNSAKKAEETTAALDRLAAQVERLASTGMRVR